MIKKLEINSSKIKKERKILLISDIHKNNKERKDNLLKLKEDLKEEFNNINYIIITGDIIDSPKDLIETDFVEELKKYIETFTEGKETFIVLGNHDIVCDDVKDDYLYQILNSIKNVKCLNNEEIIKLNDISIEGFSPNNNYYIKSNGNKCEFERQFKEVKTSKLNKKIYNILLTHDPSSILELANIDSDLVISGHMHNGLVPNKLQKIMKQRGFIGPYKRVFPKYSYGNFERGNTKYIILGAINTRQSMPLINKMYGYDATILTLKPKK